MKQQTQEIFLNLRKKSQSLVLCDSFSLLLWGFSTPFSFFLTSC